MRAIQNFFQKISNNSLVLTEIVFCGHFGAHASVLDFDKIFKCLSLHIILRLRIILTIVKINL